MWTRRTFSSKPACTPIRFAASPSVLLARRAVANGGCLLQCIQGFLDREKHRRLERAQGAAGADREGRRGHRDVIGRLPQVVRVELSKGIPETVQLAANSLDVLRRRGAPILGILD